jgi:hypothetical protein
MNSNCSVPLEMESARFILPGGSRGVRESPAPEGSDSGRTLSKYTTMIVMSSVLRGYERGETIESQRITHYGRR